ncbi:MAG TPA: FkbM family methyltransferase [Bosea sp. (in: a-proteobacteria)]|jgi:FkbM family methyltransferase|uniref:FkbM family methyltransferase n=1 Tax=Bosea sp. (in: a-proteobacteria) TaxID=1871050 RepID=UPI002E12079F|nr:FkbM family methyltransferase [Bosea sp. (in: a-proteobacteria)]
MGALFRIRDLAIKALVRRQWAELRPNSPRLAVIPHEHVGLAVLTNGLYEREELSCLTNLIREQRLGGGTCLDIGANIGNHAVVWSELFVSVVCFEPNPHMSAVLRANLDLNDCVNVRIVEAGLGPQDAELPFSFHEEGNDGSGTFAKGTGNRTLPVRHGDRLVAELGLNAHAITFVKCDVEGFEHSVFQGLSETLAQHKPVIAFESNSAELGASSWNVLRGLGYDRLYTLRHTAQTASPLKRELVRLFRGHECRIEPVDAPPAFPANLLAAARPLI